MQMTKVFDDFNCFELQSPHSGFMACYVKMTNSGTEQGARNFMHADLGESLVQ